MSARDAAAQSPPPFNFVASHVDNVFDEVAIGRLLSNPFGLDLTLTAPPRTFGMGFSMKL